MTDDQLLDRLDDIHRNLVDLTKQVATLIEEAARYTPKIKPGIYGSQGLTIGELRKMRCYDCGAAAFPHPYRHPLKLWSGTRRGETIPPVSRSQMKLPMPRADETELD